MQPGLPGEGGDECVPPPPESIQGICCSRLYTLYKCATSQVGSGRPANKIKNINVFASLSVLQPFALQPTKQPLLVFNIWLLLPLMGLGKSTYTSVMFADVLSPKLRNICLLSILEKYKHIAFHCINNIFVITAHLFPFCRPEDFCVKKCTV